jgi:hypothetical protein
MTSMTCQTSAQLKYPLASTRELGDHRLLDRSRENHARPQQAPVFRTQISQEKIEVWEFSSKEFERQLQSKAKPKEFCFGLALTPPVLQHVCGLL